MTKASMAARAVQSTMSYTLPPLHRHLSTIGIGPVFVCMPPHSLPPPPPLADGHVDDVAGGGSSVARETQSSLNAETSLPNRQSPEAAVVDTWEIVGDIKSAPEDFVVREIGWAPPRSGFVEKLESHEPGRQFSINKYARRPGWHRGMAGLDFQLDSAEVIAKSGAGDGENSVLGEQHYASQPQGMAEDGVEDDLSPPAAKKTRIEAMEYEAESTGTGSASQLILCLEPRSASTTQKSEDQSDNVSVDTDPISGLRQLLSGNCNRTSIQFMGEDAWDKCAARGENEPKAEMTLKELADLQSLAVKKLESASQQSAAMDTDAPHGNSGDENNAVRIPMLHLSSKEDRKRLHQYVRDAFPLLKTETVADDSDGGGGNSIKAVIDEAFFPLVPYLADPRKDLLQLYKYRNAGPVPAKSNGRNSDRSRSNHGKRRRKNEQHSRNEPEGGDPETHGDSTPKADDGTLLLRLRPDVPRSERGAIHRILSSGRRRDFDTSTINDVLLDPDDANAKLTSAIVVQWSLNAIRASQKKRKLDGDSGSGEGRSSISATFCVVKKDQCEHQVALQSLARTLRCRPGDIGVAGMKDLHAVTYQYCTLRNVDVRRARRANQALGGKVQLSGMVGVQDFLLNRGHLLGNRFEVTLRNMKRVRRLQTEGEEAFKETLVPVRRSHIDAVVKRLQDHGFINFYGEQRVGDAGLSSFVGVRSFDVGKEMLKRDFTKAIDLLMTGRSNQVYNPGAEESNAREVWRKSGGDARATLKAFPKSQSTMVRERDLMKGLLRYGDPLDAFRCISHNVRMFWIHAYQSYVWNTVASERIRRYGLNPVKGDLYIRGDQSNDGEGEHETALNVQVVKDPSSVDVSQLVLPLPGYNIQYPSNEIGDLYREILDADGVDLSVKDSISEATAKGSYRKLIQKASGLTWDVISEQATDDTNTPEDPVVDNARFAFELESGCYATMMLRELMVTTMARSSKVDQ